jgi:hypothetical protein
MSECNVTLWLNNVIFLACGSVDSIVLSVTPQREHRWKPVAESIGSGDSHTALIISGIGL